MRIVLLGAPGCGKGTQGQRLAATYRVPEISTGDLLREAVAAGTALGRAAKAVMDAGQLVSDEIVLGAIRERLKLGDTDKGFVLDGFPRNTAQAEQLDELLDQLGQPIDVAVLIEVDVDMIMQRLLGRRTCTSCGASYNTFYSPPRIDDSCDECGGRLKRRSDDNEETIGNRLRIYETQSLPVIERYRQQGRLRVVQGLGEIDDVFRAVTKAIEEAKASFADSQRSAAIHRAVLRKQLAQPTDSDEKSEEQTASESSTESTLSEAAAPPESAEEVPAKVPSETKPAKRPAKKAAAKAKAAKKTAKKVAKKAVTKGKAAKKTAKKVAKKAVTKGKAAKKTAKKVSKKAVTKGKAAKITAKKVAKKAVTKGKAAKITAKKVTKKAATKAKATKKAVRKAVLKKVAKKTVVKKAATKKKVVKRSGLKKKSAAGKLRAKKTAKTSAARAAAKQKRRSRQSPARSKLSRGKTTVVRKKASKKNL